MAEEKTQAPDKAIVLAAIDKAKMGGDPIDKVVKEECEKLPWSKRRAYKKEVKRALQVEIRNAAESLKTIPPNTPEYTKASENIKLLAEAYCTLTKNKTEILKVLWGSLGTLAAIGFAGWCEAHGHLLRGKSGSLIK